MMFTNSAVLKLSLYYHLNASFRKSFSFFFLCHQKPDINVTESGKLQGSEEVGERSAVKIPQNIHCDVLFLSDEKRMYEDFQVTAE